MTAPIMSTSVLRTMHRIHRQISDLKERLERGPKQVKAGKAHVAHQEEHLANSQAESKAVRVATDGKQLQLKAGEDKIKDLLSKLNMASSNREYQALKDQIAAEKMADSVLDDEILEGWDKLEQFQDKVDEAEKTLENARQKAAKVAAEVKRQEPLIRADLERLEKELSQCEAGLPATVAELYQRVVRQKGEDALAVVENETCGGCNQRVPLNVCAEIMLDHPMFCKSCGRLLYMPEDASLS